MSKRILILSASVGAGHGRAAEAIEVAMRQSHPDFVVRYVDVLELTNKAFRKVYAEAYFDLFKTMPHAVGYLYDLLDKPSRSGYRVMDKLRRVAQKVQMKQLRKLLREERWHLIINTHFLPAEIVACLRQDEKIDTPQVAVTTDFDTHRLWVNEPCEHYFTANEAGRRNLHSMGIAESKSTATGIPIHPLFSEDKPREQCLKNLGLVGDRPVVLQLAGGFGVGPIEALHRALLEVEHPLELVVVAGRNEKVRKRLAKVAAPQRHRCHVLGFTRQIDELMTAADIIVTKPGGLTTSESLAKGLAMVVANPIPGQESRNSDFILENGIGVKVNSLSTLSFKMQQLLEDRPRLEQMQHNARRCARPRAAFDVVERALQVIA